MLGASNSIYEQAVYGDVELQIAGRKFLREDYLPMKKLPLVRGGLDRGWAMFAFDVKHLPRLLEAGVAFKLTFSDVYTNSITAWWTNRGATSQ